MSQVERAYVSELGTGQQIYVQNQGTQTLLTLSSNTPGQQQSQTSQFATGEWLLPPTLLRSIAGFMLRIETSQGQNWIQIQTNSIQILTAAPPLQDAAVVPLQPVIEHKNSVAPLQPMQPMSPMQPMRMGNMEMQMNPMQMRMGDMEMKMGKEPSMSPSPSHQVFCSQCGQAVQAGDRFCSNCGHRLDRSS